MNLIEDKSNHPDVADFAERIAKTGSRVICNPAPTDTDIDFVVQVSSRMWNTFDILDLLDTKGYTHNTGESNTYNNMLSFDREDGFMSFRKGEVNYIITPSKVFFENFCLATICARELNLTDKDDRIKLFRKFLYGEGV